MGKIILERSEYSFDQIKNGQWSEDDSYLHQAFSFCQEWLNGRETFELTTSGSTGKPKRIMVSRQQMEISAAATKAYLKIDSESTLLCCLNTEMIAGKMMLVRAMEWNAELILVKPKENPLGDPWIDFNIDFAAMVPLQVQACFANDDSLRKLKNIGTLIIGGAPSSASLKEKLVIEKINAFQTFGMTETVSHIALAPIAKDELIFDTLPGVIIGTDNENQLWIQATMAIEEKLQTNDIVELLNKSQFKWLGRSDFTINSGGIKIQPEILEPQLSPFIKDHFGNIPFFIYGEKDEKLGQKLLLVMEGKKYDENEKNFFRDALKSSFENFLVPKQVMFIDKFVRTESGKINRLETIKSIT